MITIISLLTCSLTDTLPKEIGSVIEKVRRETLSNSTDSWNISKFYRSGPKKSHSPFNFQTEPLMQTWSTGSIADPIYKKAMANNSDRAQD